MSVEGLNVPFLVDTTVNNSFYTSNYYISGTGGIISAGISGSPQFTGTMGMTGAGSVSVTLQPQSQAYGFSGMYVISGAPSAASENNLNGTLIYENNFDTASELAEWTIQSPYSGGMCDPYDTGNGTTLTSRYNITQRPSWLLIQPPMNNSFRNFTKFGINISGENATLFTKFAYYVDGTTCGQGSPTIPVNYIALIVNFLSGSTANSVGIAPVNVFPNVWLSKFQVYVNNAGYQLTGLNNIQGSYSLQTNYGLIHKRNNLYYGYLGNDAKSWYLLGSGSGNIMRAFDGLGMTIAGNISGAKLAPVVGIDFIKVYSGNIFW